MIISHKYRFIFVKNLKTAGTSIEVYLSPLCGEEDVFTPIWPQEPGHVARNDSGFANHMPASDIRSRVAPDIWQGYFKFTVERNPWDKTVSHYAMERHRSGGSLPWDVYMAHAEKMTTHFMYTDPSNGTLLVDRVLRYESLETELGEVFGKLGVPWNGSLAVSAKSGYRDSSRHYRDYFSRAERDDVAKAFAWEIERFGYEF